MQTEALPTLDLTELERSPRALAELDRLCAGTGAFQLTGHGVDPGMRAETLAQIRAFFALPDAEKQALSRTEANPLGFFDRELTKNRRDWKQIWDFGPACHAGPLAGSVPQFPDRLPAFRVAMERWFAHSHTLAFRVLDVLARGLGVEPAALRRDFGTGDGSFLRLNWYPRCPDPAPHDLPLDAEGSLGIRHHTDSGALTVLLHDAEPGMQLLGDGGWRLVEPREDALLVVLGDVVQVWSNDRWRAPLHRVIAHADRDRYSAPFFLNPSYDCTYAPLAPQCGPGRPARYRPIRWSEFRARRAAGDYADRGEEVQISDWRVVDEGAERLGTTASLT
ncbi:MAG: 2OG-Fe(II) oxygenase family protein [Myxococcota bacterium]